jgi:hypothetical protein
VSVRYLHACNFSTLEDEEVKENKSLRPIIS